MSSMANIGPAAVAEAETEPALADGGSRAARLRALGAEIRSLRTGRGLSTVALARTCGVSPSMVSQVERGLTAPSLEVLWAIARALDVPIGTFFQQTDAGTGDDQAAAGVLAAASATEPATSAAQPQARTATDSASVRGARVVRAGERKRLGLTPSLTYQLLSPDLQHRIEFVWVEFGPGEEGPLAPFTHQGEEQMVVIQGEMHVWINGEIWVLGVGDAIAFDSSLPHRSMNHGAAPAIIIAAITPPSF